MSQTDMSRSDAGTAKRHGAWRNGRPVELDDRDHAILLERLGSMSADGPQVGEWVDFADGKRRRISHVWPGEWHDDGIARLQTSDGGSWYLADGCASFSGSLFSGVRADLLTLTGEAREGSCWFFHHDYHTAHNGVDVLVPWRVWSCSVEATR